MMPQSPSSLAVFTGCPAKYQSQYILKTYKHTGDTSAMDEGNRLHKAVELAVGGTPLPEEYKFMQRVVDILKEAEQGKGYTVAVEQSLAITREGKPVQFFSKEGYLRCKVDALIVAGDTAVVIDWKTGKKRDYEEQLAINVKCVQAVYGVKKVFTLFAFVKHDEFSSTFIGEHGHISLIMLEQHMKEIEEAYATDHWPAKPSGLCRAWCGNFDCEFNGLRE